MFVEEQGVPESLEIDEFDATAQHFIAIQNKHVVATLRLVFKHKTAKLGRLAVAKEHRHQGIATRLMQQAHQHCRKLKLEKIELGAQIRVKSFYQKQAYQEVGNIFMDAGIPHILMVKDLH